MTVVTMQEDIFPHVKGSVVDLDKDEQKRVDVVAKARHISKPYVSGAKEPEGAVTDSREARVQQATAEREAAQSNAVDQAAQLEAQRTAVGEPANVDALGVVPEHPAQVVTGTAPVENVEVTNPQQATDVGDPKGAEVKGAKSKSSK
jgi:hypothetical protein